MAVEYNDLYENNSFPPWINLRRTMTIIIKAERTIEKNNKREQ